MVKQRVLGASWIGSDQLGGISRASPHTYAKAIPATGTPYLAREASPEADGVGVGRRAGLEAGGSSGVPSSFSLPLCVSAREQVAAEALALMSPGLGCSAAAVSSPAPCRRQRQRQAP